MDHLVLGETGSAAVAAATGCGKVAPWTQTCSV